MKIGFQQKLLSSFIMVILLAIFPLTIFLSSNLKSRIWERTEESLRRELILLEEIVRSETAPPFESSGVDILIDRLARELNVRVTFISKNGTVFGDSTFSISELTHLDNHAERPEVLEALKGSFGKSIRHSASTGSDFLYMAAPLRYGQQIEGVIRAAVPVSEIESLIAETQRVLMAGISLSVVIALVLSFLIARRLAYPVNIMTRIAHKMAKRDFTEKIKIRTHDQHAELAYSLNQMSDELERHIRELSRVHSELEAAFSGMKEGILVVNDKGEIVQFNEAFGKMFRIDQNLSGQTELEAIRHVPLHNMIVCVLETGAARSGELSLSAPNPLVLSVSITPLKQENEIQGAAAVFHDITELRKLERLRRDFVANVSHELKTPLTAIKGFAEILANTDIKDDSLLRKNIEIIHRKAGELESLISDVLDLAAIESGEIQMKRDTIRTATLLESVIDELRNTIREKDLHVTIQANHSFPQFYGDERWIRQALLNLTSNAVRYTNPGGSITLAALPENGHTVLKVKDTGIGISAQDLPRIFERFYRTDKARARVSGGTGLGLSIVKHVVEAHNGQISVESEVGKGSTFQIILPA